MNLMKIETTKMASDTAGNTTTSHFGDQIRVDASVIAQEASFLTDPKAQADLFLPGFSRHPDKKSFKMRTIMNTIKPGKPVDGKTIWYFRLSRMAMAARFPTYAQLIESHLYMTFDDLTISLMATGVPATTGAAFTMAYIPGSRNMVITEDTDFKAMLAYSEAANTAKCSFGQTISLDYSTLTPPDKFNNTVTAPNEELGIVILYMDGSPKIDLGNTFLPKIQLGITLTHNMVIEDDLEFMSGYMELTNFELDKTICDVYVETIGVLGVTLTTKTSDLMIPPVHDMEFKYSVRDPTNFILQYNESNDMRIGDQCKGTIITGTGLIHTVDNIQYLMLDIENIRRREGSHVKIPRFEKIAFLDKIKEIRAQVVYKQQQVIAKELPLPCPNDQHVRSVIALKQTDDRLLNTVERLHKLTLSATEKGAINKPTISETIRG